MTNKMEWYTVKLLYECVVTGEPSTETIDDNYTNVHKTYEESIMLVKAESFEHAYSIAEEKAKEAEFDYVNPYDEQVSWKFVDALDCSSVSEEELESGIEVYSRFLHVPKEVPTKEVVSHYYPETVEEHVVDHNWVLRNGEINVRPNTEY